MRVLQLKERHRISDNDLASFALSTQQQLFIEEYLSNGMLSTDAAYFAVTSTNEKIKEEKDEVEDKRYFSMRASALMKTRGVEAYLAKVAQKSSNVATINQVLEVMTSILHDTDAENKDRIKAGEHLLKVHGAFSKHQEAKAPKSLTYNNINKMTDKELEEELKKRLSDVSIKSK